MRTYIDFDALFAGRTEVFRLEGRAAYSSLDERSALGYYRRSRAIVPPANDWPQIVRDATAAGTTIRRLRLVSAPLSAYETWQLGVFASGWATGEDIRVLPRAHRPYRGDVWVLDRDRALWLIHDRTGALTGIEHRPADAACQYWIRCWDAATTVTEYRAPRADAQRPENDLARPELAGTELPSPEPPGARPYVQPPIISLRPSFSGG